MLQMLKTFRTSSTVFLEIVKFSLIFLICIVLKKYIIWLISYLWRRSDDRLPNFMTF